VFEHEPGKYGRTRSFIISDLMYPLFSIQYGEQRLGRFLGVAPLPEFFPASKSRLLILSYSYKGRGHAFHARQNLRELLPKRLHKAIGKAQRWRSRKRNADLSPAHETMYQSWLSELGTGIVQDLACYVDPHDFWLIARGRVDPDKVRTFVTHQISLF